MSLATSGEIHLIMAKCQFAGGEKSCPDIENRQAVAERGVG